MNIYEETKKYVRLTQIDIIVAMVHIIPSSYNIILSTDFVVVRVYRTVFNYPYFVYV